MSHLARSRNWKMQIHADVVFNPTALDWHENVLTVGFLHLHEILEGLYFHFSLSVSLCVCMCVQRFLVNKIPAERMYRFGHGFR